MTCIIASRRWVCADRRVSDESGASSHLVKVASNPWIIAAAAGHASATVAVKRAIREGARTAADLLAVVDAGSCALVLTWDGVLSHISEGIVWPALERGARLAAIGSGSDLALGYMAGAGSTSPITAREAQRYVARRRTDCGGGCDVRSF